MIKRFYPSSLRQLELALREFQPNGAEASEEYGKIIDERHWQRLKDMLDSTKGKVLMGGKSDRSTCFFEPTVVQVESADDPLLTDESFGPLMPVLAFDDLDEAIRVANKIHATPLGLYPFGSQAETEKILSQTRSGGASVNDAFFHASIPTLAFGGVGDSGQGAYRGKASFDCFTHRRSVTTTPSWIEGMLGIRYPPFTPEKFKKAEEDDGSKAGLRQEWESYGWTFLVDFRPGWEQQDKCRSSMGVDCPDRRLHETLHYRKLIGSPKKESQLISN